MSTNTAVANRSVQLNPELAGKLVRPGDERFDQVRSAWNLAVDQQPAAVILAETAEDVRAAVGLAAECRLQIAAQGTGHNAAPFGPLADTVLLRTDRMRGIRIDPQARTARSLGGARVPCGTRSSAPLRCCTPGPS